MKISGEERETGEISEEVETSRGSRTFETEKIFSEYDVDLGPRLV